MPAANIGWFSTVLYTFATGSFVANVSWQDQNLPQLFQQALTIITNADQAVEFAAFEAPVVVRAAPLIALYRAGFRFLPSFLNGCFIYSALSCANTALYVASRQLYGMTRTVTIDSDSGIMRSTLVSLSTLNYRTKTPWPAIAISGLVFCWLPFIRIRSNDEFLQDGSQIYTYGKAVSDIFYRFKTPSSTLVPSPVSSCGVLSAWHISCSTTGKSKHVNCREDRSLANTPGIGANSTLPISNFWEPSGKSCSTGQMEAT